MFGKIKNKLRNVFEKNKDVLEESEEKIIETNLEKDDSMKKEIKNENKNIESLSVNEEKEIEKNDDNILSKTFKKIKNKKISEEDFEKIWIELEIFLLEINVAFEIVEKIKKRLKEELIGNSFNRFNLNKKIKNVLFEEVKKVLILREENFMEKLREIKSKNEIVKILVLGVNGTGKTTTIAKFVNYLQKKKLSVVVAAADTFRAAAVEQLDEHSKKLNFKLIKHKNGSDPASVAFDAIEHARAKKIDVVLIDTAGRMPNNSNLMQELQKINRVSKSNLVIFVGDSISGNDLIEQINLFNSGVEIDGVILTKVDTDERPGSIITTAFSIEKPIYFLGVGQKYEDLIEFNAEKIAKNLFMINEDK